MAPVRPHLCYLQASSPLIALSGHKDSRSLQVTQQKFMIQVCTGEELLRGGAVAPPRPLSATTGAQLSLRVRSLRLYEEWCGGGGVLKPAKCTGGCLGGQDQRSLAGNAAPLTNQRSKLRFFSLKWGQLQDSGGTTMVIGGFAGVSVQVKKCVMKIFHNMYVCLCMIIGYTGKVLEETWWNRCMRVCGVGFYD